jgi:hypothetical protein
MAETPEPPELSRTRSAATPETAAAWVLRVAVCSQCIAAAWVSFNDGTPIALGLALHGFPTAAAVQIDVVSAAVMAAAGISALVWPTWPLLGFAGTWMGLIAAAACLTGGSFFQWVEPAAHAARWGAPIALVMLMGRRDLGAIRLLRIAAALTFVAHGTEAILYNPTFIAYFVSAGHKLLGIGLEVPQIKQMLYAIGLIDWALAALILCTRWRTVAAYMAVWGMITAWARLVHGGWAEGWDGMAIRLTNSGAPAALWIYWHLTLASRSGASASEAPASTPPPQD